MARLKVFVYGTLKRNYCNHHKISCYDSTQYIGEAKTLQKYPMIVAKGYTFPFLLDKTGEGKIIKGEVFEIDEEDAKCLDKFEKLYEREVIPVSLSVPGNSNGTTIECWCYIYKKYLPEHLELPFLDVF